MSLAVCNSSPLIHLCSIQKIDLLRQLHSPVLIPEAVRKEVIEDGAGRAGADEIAHGIRAGWIEVHPAQDSTLLALLRLELDPGEAEAIALAVEKKPDARSKAHALGLPVAGTLGLLIRAKRERRIPALKPVLKQLGSLGHFWIGRKLYEHALREVDEWSPADGNP
jgi:uncharacterized protein